MKKLASLLALLLVGGASAFAQKTADALRLTLKSLSDNTATTEYLFTWKPVITYTPDHKSMILTCEGKDSMTVALADVVNMTFFDSNGKLDNIEKAFPLDPTSSAAEGTYTLDGKRVDAITTPGTYIINGKKVLVK